jgi:hypothetical protein
MLLTNKSVSFYRRSIIFSSRMLNFFQENLKLLLAECLVTLKAQLLFCWNQNSYIVDSALLTFFANKISSSKVLTFTTTSYINPVGRRFSTRNLIEILLHLCSFKLGHLPLRLAILRFNKGFTIVKIIVPRIRLVVVMP